MPSTFEDTIEKLRDLSDAANEEQVDLDKQSGPGFINISNPFANIQSRPARDALRNYLLKLTDGELFAIAATMDLGRRRSSRGKVDPVKHLGQELRSLRDRDEAIAQVVGISDRMKHIESVLQRMSDQDIARLPNDAEEELRDNH